MRVIADTNILISALLIGHSLPAHLITLWRDGRFELLTATEQIEELRRVTRYKRLRERLAPALAGRLINELRDIAVVVPNLQVVSVSRDPFDDYLLALAVAGSADYLVTGDKSDLLGIGVYHATRIVSVRNFLDTIMRIKPGSVGG